MMVKTSFFLLFVWGAIRNSHANGGKIKNAHSAEYFNQCLGFL